MYEELLNCYFHKDNNNSIYTKSLMYVYTKYI